MQNLQQPLPPPPQDVLTHVLLFLIGLLLAAVLAVASFWIWPLPS